MSTNFEMDTISVLAREDLIGRVFIINKFPEVTLSYTDYQNNLCGSNYNSNIKCFWEGDLSIAFYVNGVYININDHDKRNNKFHIVLIGRYQYIFQGLGSIVYNKSRNETYLQFMVIKRDIEDKSSMQIGPWETISAEKLYGIVPL